MTHDWTKDAESMAEAAFALACTLDQFGYTDLARRMDKSSTWARNRVQAWIKAGLLEEVPADEGAPWQWRVKDSARQALQVRARSPEDNLWTAMRQMKSFSPRTLAAHATTETVAISLENAQAYCRALLGAGYLAVARKAVPGRTEPIYRLIRNTGPRPPREKRVRAVIDANTEQTIVIGGGQ
ncbi:MAG: hypothetical protein MUE52_04265 [Tabrizicola sp.]|jgi:hypothetical protein|nr:hypothetical protein [Tabrizicola sp.]